MKGVSTKHGCQKQPIWFQSSATLLQHTLHQRTEHVTGDLFCDSNVHAMAIPPMSYATINHLASAWLSGYVRNVDILGRGLNGLVGSLVAPHLNLLSEALFSVPWLFLYLHVYNQLAKTHAAN